ncbi:AsmA family protein [Chitinimonas sp.]|uniref:AsmA family protein n=1 Tax=Chitinimonas sp. TaxID=1934313 RepID=UPI0035AEEBBA
MKPVLKYLLVGGGSLLACALAGLGYIAATFDPEALKPKLEQLVKDKKQRTLQLAGPISLSFFPRLGATLGDVSLSEHGSDAQFAHIGNARVALQFWPLLKKRVVVDAIELDGAKATLRRDGKGKLNIDDLLQQDEPSSDAPVDFDVSRIRVRNVALQFDDMQSHQQLSLDKLSLSADGLSPQGARNVEAAAHLVLAAPQLDLQWVAKLGQLQLAADKQQFSLRQLAVSAQGSKGEQQFKLDLAAPALSVDAQQLQGEQVALQLGLQQAAQTLDGSVKLDGLSGSAQEVAVKTLSLSGKVRQGAQTATFDLAGPFSASRADEAAKLTLAGKVDGGDIKLAAAFNAGARPAASVDLQAGNVDLDRYLPPAKPATEASAAPAKLDLSALKDMHLQVSARIARLKKLPLDARDIVLAVHAADGLIVLDQASLKLFGGELQASGSATASREPHITLRPRASNVDINLLLKQLAGFDRLEGHGFVDADIRAQGADVAALKASASGNVRIRLSGGALRGVNLGKLVRDAKAAIGTMKGGAQSFANNNAEKTDFTELSASLLLNNGVGRNSDLLMKSPLLRVAGEGDINLRNDSLNYLVKASLVNTDEGQGGKERHELAGITVPVRVQGPFTQPAYSLDMSAAIKENATAQVKEKTKDLLKQGLGGLFRH